MLLLPLLQRERERETMSDHEKTMISARQRHAIARVAAARLEKAREERKEELAKTVSKQLDMEKLSYVELCRSIDKTHIHANTYPNHCLKCKPDAILINTNGFARILDSQLVVYMRK